MLTLNDGRSELWQWDTGRTLAVDADCSQVHFSNKVFGRSIDVDVADGVAIIPDILLQTDKDLNVWAFVGTAENGYTKISKTFNVNRRNKPAGYVFTPADQMTLQTIQSQIGDLSGLTTDAKDTLVAAINEAAASGGGADWAQNDPDGDGYVKNRPGGYMTDPVITDVGTFTITSADDEGGIYMAIVAVESSAITLSDYAIGDGVIVDFGGQSYSLTWRLAEGMPACGATVTGEAPDWSSAPFFIMAVFGQEGGLQGYYVYLQNAVTSPIQVKLTMAKQTPVKIPEKYLELDSAKEITQFTISYNQSSEEYESDRTYDELKAALDAGKTVFAKFRNVMGEFYTYGLLYQRAMYAPGIWVYVGGGDPCEWLCSKGTKWTKRQLLRLGTGYTTPKKAGTSAYGTSDYASRDDHVHPSELPDVSADDDGKLLGVTGGAWGKVDKPSGGIDMGITGAAVGQIAKITAVDASGTPTAWAPVDMPSGMSEWQLITDTTIAQEDASTTLFVSQKDSGESFLCHELLIAWIGIAVTDGTQSGKAWISLNPDKAGYNSGKCGLSTKAYFYYTQQANYMRNMHVKSLPYKVEYVDIEVSTNDSIDAQVIWQNGISSVEVSAYGRKSFYGRVIIYGR